MDDGLGTALAVVLGVLAAVGLVLVLGTVYLLRKYRLPLRGVAATISGLLYVLSPVDAVPEIPLGPVGLVDDVAVIIAGLLYIHRLVEARGPAARRDHELVSDPAATRHPRAGGGRR